jgi:hypothetical protein
VKETTAQDASGTTIAPWHDLRVAVFLVPAETERSCGTSRIGIGGLIEQPGTGQEAVDAAGPMDAQTAPTGPWKTADGFPQAPTAISGSSNQERSRQKHQTWPATGPQPLPSSAAVASGAPFADPSPAEIVVADRALTHSFCYRRAAVASRSLLPMERTQGGHDGQDSQR